MVGVGVIVDVAVGVPVSVGVRVMVGVGVMSVEPPQFKPAWASAASTSDMVTAPSGGPASQGGSGRGLAERS
jgi:hypothetical protein